MTTPTQTQGDIKNVPVYTPAPLPPGWTEHRAPTGQFYYYHAASGESTYVRPSAKSPNNEDQSTKVDSSASASNGNQNESGSKKKKNKEKPKLKEPIPDTAWLKVTTTEGNVFYTNTENKTSLWTVPEEIKDQVARFELEKLEEQNRIKAEELRLQELERKRLIDEEVAKVRAEVEAEVELRALKRKDPPEQDSSKAPPSNPSENQPNPSNGGERASKTPKIEENKDGDEDEDAAWQRQIAEEMALEAAAEDPEPVVPLKQVPIAPTSNNPPPAVPQGLSLEELRATFKAMLLEKSIDPMAPWDNELPKFVTDSRYLALPSMKERRDLFDEFCKEKIRQQRAAKQSAPKLDPPQAYRSLLVEFVTSTRTLWEEFKSKHKKDPRFRNFGRDDREREKVFKSWLKELGELKRKELTKAEESFKTFLRQNSDSIKALKSWKEVRERLKGIDGQKFELIGSNSTKELIWKKWLEEDDKRSLLTERKKSSEDIKGRVDRKNLELDKKSKEENSLRAREQEVRRMKANIEKQTGITKNLVGREEAEREFKLLLIDIVKDHDMRWEEVRPILERDPRYQRMNHQISKNELIDIFESHLDSIYEKRLKVLESFFEQQARLPSKDDQTRAQNNPLTITFSRIKESLLKLLDKESCLNPSDPLDQRLNNGSSNSNDTEEILLVSILKRLLSGNNYRKSYYDSKEEEEEEEDDRRYILRKVEKYFQDWKSKKHSEARKEFEEMMGESSFIEFWCRIKKAEIEKKRSSGSKDEEGKDGLIRNEGEEDEEEDEVVDLREMAKSIDIDEIESILKKDHRWIVFNHLSEERELWIREYLNNLAAPKKTVYQKDQIFV